MRNEIHTLRALALERFGTVTAFAQAAAIERRTAYRLFAGLGVRLETAKRVAAALDVTVDDVVELAAAPERKAS